jgi:ketosteroid isomerase-like protein
LAAAAAAAASATIILLVMLVGYVHPAPGGTHHASGYFQETLRWRLAVSDNKATVTRYMDGFNTLDHARILACLTDDVEWEIPGAFHIAGKAAFDREIENDAFVGRPTVTVTRLLEEGDVVVAEGTVQTTRKDGGLLNLVFCDVFLMREAKIRRLTSYLVPLG